MSRKIVEIAVATAAETDVPAPQLFALCDDGSLWTAKTFPTWRWDRVPDIPQDNDDPQS